MAISTSCCATGGSLQAIFTSRLEPDGEPFLVPTYFHSARIVLRYIPVASKGIRALGFDQAGCTSGNGGTDQPYTIIFGTVGLGPSDER